MKCDAYYPFFRNLSNPVRIKIISALKKKSLSVSEISKVTGIEQSKLSHALASLKYCRIVESKQKGKKCKQTQ